MQGVEKISCAAYGIYASKKFFTQHSSWDEIWVFRGSLCLRPRQSFKPPAVVGIAVVAIIQVSLKAVQHVVHLGEPGFFQSQSGIDRAATGAADQYDRAVCAGCFFYV